MVADETPAEDACGHPDTITVMVDTGRRKCADCGEMIARPAAVADQAGEDVRSATAIAHDLRFWSRDNRHRDLLVEAADKLDEQATAIRERDEARAKVDGGEWQWGVRWDYRPGKPIDWLTGSTEQAARNYVGSLRPAMGTLIRRWVGEVETVGEDGSGT